MIIEIYIFLAGLTAAVLLLSWYRPQVIMFLWISALLCPIMALLTLDINLVVYDGGWQTYLIQDIALSWFWYGMSALAIGWAILNTILILTGFYKQEQDTYG